MEEFEIFLDDNKVFDKSWERYKEMSASAMGLSGIDLDDEKNETTQSFKTIFACGVLLACRFAGIEINTQIKELLKEQFIVPRKPENK